MLAAIPTLGMRHDSIFMHLTGCLFTAAQDHFNFAPQKICCSTSPFKSLAFSFSNYQDCMFTDDITSVRQQYLDTKHQHSNKILLFRLGDFYETFDDVFVSCDLASGF